MYGPEVVENAVNIVGVREGPQDWIQEAARQHNVTTSMLLEI